MTNTYVWGNYFIWRIWLTTINAYKIGECNDEFGSQNKYFKFSKSINISHPIIMFDQNQDTKQLWVDELWLTSIMLTSYSDLRVSHCFSSVHIWKVWNHADQRRHSICSRGIGLPFPAYARFNTRAFNEMSVHQEDHQVFRCYMGPMTVDKVVQLAYMTDLINCTIP